MAVRKQARVAVTATPAQIDQGLTDGRVSVRNLGTASVWLGSGTAITSSTGFELAVGEACEERLFAGLDLWAVAASGTVNVAVDAVGNF